MLGLFFDEWGVADRGSYVEQLLRAQRVATRFALVTISFFKFAVGASAFEVAVSEEEFEFRIVVLFSFEFL